MTDIGAHEEVLRLKRHIATDLLDRVLGNAPYSVTEKNIPHTQEAIWAIFEYFYNKLIEKDD